MKSRTDKFTRETWDAVRVFSSEGDIPTNPRGISLADELLKAAQPVRRRALRPTWPAVAAAGIVGTLGGALIAILSMPWVG